MTQMLLIHGTGPGREAVKLLCSCLISVIQKESNLEAGAHPRWPCP